MHQIYHLILTQEVFQMVHFSFGIDGNAQKLLTSNDTCLTVAIADPIISESLPFHLAQKPRFKKVLE